MTQPPMRIGAVGVGVHAVAILPNLPVAGMQLAATCARHLERAEQVGTRFGAALAFDDVERMLAEAELDGVVVVVPPDQFAGVIEACIRRGVPVFTEKPAANDAAEAHALAAQAAEAGVTVMVGYMKRFAGAYVRAKEILATPGFGVPTLGSFTWSMGPFAHRFDMRDWLFENPVHHFDLARFFLGELDDVHVRRGTGTEHTVVVTATSASGAIVSICANTTGSWGQRNEAVEIFGDGHSLYVDNLATCIHRPPRATRARVAAEPHRARGREHDRRDDGVRQRARALPPRRPRGHPVRVGMASAAATLDLASTIVDLALAR